jgi:DNA-binding NtrC family response regulator
MLNSRCRAFSEGDCKMVRNARVLVVDDDRTIVESLVAVLEDEGYFVDTAKNGKEAIAKSNSHFYNVAIVDWRLPDIEGTKLLGELKQTTPKTAKIMLTGFPSIENTAEAVNRHADAFFIKPVEISALLAKIKELLKLQEEEVHYSQERVAEFIETRTRDLLEAKTNQKTTTNE